MKLNLRLFTRSVAMCFAAALSVATASAQTQTTWIGAASGGEWNTDASWDALLTPGVGTNALIATATNVNYNVPMSAASFLGLTNKGTLNINAAGFNVSTISMTNIGSRLFINSGGVLTAGNILMCSNAQMAMFPGSTVTITRLDLGCDDSGSSAAASGPIHGFAGFTNNGGILNIGSTFLNAGNQSIGANTIGLVPKLMILGGTNNLGALTINRLQGGASASPVYGVDGLTVSNGVVTTTRILLGNNAHGLLLMVGGTFTNAGAFTVRNNTSTRPARFVQLGGFFSSASTSTNVLMSGFGTATNGDTVYAVLGGTNSVNGFQFGGYTNFFTFVTNLDLSVTTNVNSLPSPNLVLFTNAATINIGQYGIASNGVTLVNAALNTGGRFMSAADWTNTAPLTMAGGAFVAEDIDGNPHNIYSSGDLRGSGSWIKSGAGTMTLAASNTVTGNTFINAGTLALVNNGVTTFGSLASSAIITVGAGATFDISQAPNNILPASKTMAGSGTVVGSFAASDNSFISPAGISAQGTLTFANGLLVTNITFNMELTDNPSGVTKTNDAVKITGDLTASGVNTFAITPVGSLGIGTYKLIKYTGTFHGSLANFSVPATVGTLSNPAGEIDLIVTQVRPVATLQWRGDGLANVWDTATSSNWWNATHLDRFYTGDTNIFDDTATNSNLIVTESGALFPASAANVIVKGTNNFTFTGDGSISGLTGLIKTNSGTLALLSTNSYTGVTTVNGGGTISVLTLANNGVNGPFGPIGSTANLVLDNGTLRYDGPALTVDRGFTVGPNGGTINVTNVVTLTISNNVTGPGVLTKAGNGTLTLTVLSDYAGGTVVQGGTLRPNQGNNATINVLGTNNVTLVGTNAPVTFAIGANGETIVNGINVIATNFLNLNGNDTISGLLGDGLLWVNGAADTLSLRSTDSATFTGTLYANNLSFLRFNLSSGTSANYANATFDLGSNTCVLAARDGVTAQIGALQGGPGTGISWSTVSANPSTYIIGSKNMNCELDGFITDSNSVSRRISLVKVGTATFTLTGGTNDFVDDDFHDHIFYTNEVQYIGTTVISNGVLALVAPASITNSSSVTLATSTAVFDVSQSGDPAPDGFSIIPTGYFESVSGHSVAGLGTIRGGLIIDPGANLSVGLPGTTGVLTVTNTVTLHGTTSMKLIKGNTPSSDQVASTTAGSITYGGALVVTNGGGALAVNDTFTLFSAPTLSGSFSSTNLPSDYTWDTSQLGVNGTIKVTAVLVVVAPQFSSVNFTTLKNGSITFNATGSANGPLSIRNSTDVLTPLTNWTVINTGNFDGSGNYSTNLTVSPTAPKEFYILSTP